MRFNKTQAKCNYLCDCDILMSFSLFNYLISKVLYIKILFSTFLFPDGSVYQQRTLNYLLTANIYLRNSCCMQICS